MNIELDALIRNFFNLPDWKNRSLKLGGVYLGLVSIFFLMLFIGISLLVIPLLGVLFVAFIVLIAVPIYVLYISYVEGYKLELSHAFRSKKEITSIEPLGNYKLRVSRGFKVFSGIFIYSAPFYLIIFLISFFFSFTQVLFTNYSSGDTTVFSFLNSISTNVLSLIVPYIITYLITPIISAQYIRTQSFNKLFDFSEIWGLIKRYKSEILNIAFTLFLISVTYNFVLASAILSVFLCLGLFLLPVVLAVGCVFNAHVQAELSARLSLIFDNKVDHMNDPANSSETKEKQAEELKKLENKENE